MRFGFARWLQFFPALALGATGAAAESGAETPRALSLAVEETQDSVAIELVAQSASTQRVEYSVLLTGSNTSRHSGNSQIAAGERHVLSALKTSFAESWCASVEVKEENGERYTLTAGDCT